MNILFFIIPKSQVVFVSDTDTIRQVTEKMMFHNLTAVPILSSDGKYKGSISEGDLFRYIKNHDNMNYHAAEMINIMDVSHERIVDSIRYDADINDLFEIAINQNFIPVTDDHGIFIGIITRRAILEHFKKLVRHDEESVA